MLWLATKCVWLYSFVVFAYLYRCKQWGKWICERCCHPSAENKWATMFTYTIHIVIDCCRWVLIERRVLFMLVSLYWIYYFIVLRGARARQRISKSPYVFRFKYIDHKKQISVQRYTLRGWFINNISILRHLAFRWARCSRLRINE